MASYPYVLLSNKFNTADFTSSTSGLTIEEADARYLNIGLASSILGVTAGVGQASKALILDASRNITTINSLTATTLIGTLGTSSQTGITTIGTLGGLNVNGNAVIGTISAGNPRMRLAVNGLVMYLQTGVQTTTGSSSDFFIGNIGENLTTSTRKLMYKADGKLGIGTNNPTHQVEINEASGNCLRLTYNDEDGGATVYTDFLVSSGGNLSINPTGINVNISKSLKIQYDSTLALEVTNGDTYGLLKCDTSNGSISSYGILGTFLYGKQNSAATQNLLWFGHVAVGNSWYFRHYRDPNVNNHTLEMLNTNSAVYGISYSTFSDTSTSGGAMMVLNGVNGTGSFISANQSTSLGLLHLSGGVDRTVSTGWYYASTGSGSRGSSGTSYISLYCYNNIHVRGTMYSTSDKRMKTNIENWNPPDYMNILKMTPKWFNWKDDIESAPQLGFIAQDLLLNECNDMVLCFENEEVKEDCEETGAKAGTQLVVDYQRVNFYLLEVVKNLNKRIEVLEAKYNII